MLVCLDMNIFSSILILLTNLNDIQYVRLKSRYRGPGLEFAKDFHILVSINNSLFLSLSLLYQEHVHASVQMQTLLFRLLSRRLCFVVRAG